MGIEPARQEAEPAALSASALGDPLSAPRRRTRRRTRQGAPANAISTSSASGPTQTSPDAPPPEDEAPSPAEEPESAEPDSAEADEESDEVPEAPPLPPLVLRDGLPRLTESADALADTIAALGRGTGPLAIDTERASGYRYGQRAYLIQIRRTGSGTHLIDPMAVPGVPGLAEALDGPEWILHASTQDLPCLLELDLRPATLFDTELAGRLLGMPRVGLAPMVAAILEHSLAKGHGAADWSRRPLPDDWLEYAALDVEVLIELRDELRSRLDEAGKLAWALEEFEAIRTAPPSEPRSDPWRRTAGIHQIRNRRGLAIVEQLWRTRDDVARQADIAPGRLLPDASIIAAARALPADGTALRALRSFHGRGAARYQREWGQALQVAWAIPDAALPLSAARAEGAPPARVWNQRDPLAAARLDRARRALARLAEQLVLPVENLVTPDLVRRLMWDPNTTTADDPTPEGIARFLDSKGARRWQIALVADLLAAAVPQPA